MTPTNAELRQFIVQFFSDEELDTLAFDYFPEAANDFGAGMSKSRKIIALIGHCERRGRLADLHAALQRERPEAWRQQFAAPPVETFRRDVSTSPIPRDPRQIFLSHATADAEFAHTLAADLRAEGWSVWIAPESIRPGEKWVEAIDRGLETSGVFVVVLTPAAVVSRWVRTETSAAISMEHRDLIRFIPLDVVECQPPWLWTQYQYIPFRDSYEVGLKSLLIGLDRIIIDDPGIEPRSFQHVPKLVLLVVLVALLLMISLVSDRKQGTEIAKKTFELTIEPTIAFDPTDEPTHPPDPTPNPTLMPIQTWTNETSFSIAQGWDMLVDEDGETGFESGEFFIRNKKGNILYISLWKAIGGRIGDSIISVDLIRSRIETAPDAAGIVIGWHPGSQGNTYAFLVDKKGSCKFLEESYNGWSTESTGKLETFLAQKEKHRVTVVIEEGHAFGFVDAEYCDDFLMPSYEAGYVGLAALSGGTQEDGSKGYFDNASFANLPISTNN